jgi:hypothetical protein
MMTYVALAVGFTMIGGFAYLGIKATDEIITYFGKEVEEQNKTNTPYIKKEKDE